MLRYKNRTTSAIVEAVQFDSSDTWPEGITPWKAAGYQPRDMSFGYIQVEGGKVHVMNGDWIVTNSEGERSLVREADFSRLYEVSDEIKDILLKILNKLESMDDSLISLMSDSWADHHDK